MSASPVHVLGPGALGLLWAARLSSEQPVVLIGRANREGERHFCFRAADQNQELVLPETCAGVLLAKGARLKQLLVFTKTHTTLPALETLKPLIGAHTDVVLFQNGLGAHHDCELAFPGVALFAAVTTEGANRPDAQTVVHAGSGTTQVGGLTEPAADSERLASLVQLLSGSGLQVTGHPDVREALWRKLAINCAINPFTALCGCVNGEVRQQPLFQSLWPKLRTELVSLLTLAGYPESEGGLEERVNEVIRGTAANVSSMLQDVRAGRVTEIDAINGFAAEYLQKHQVNAAASQWLWQAVSRLSGNA